MKITGIVKASHVLKLISDHIEKHGDGPFTIKYVFSDNDHLTIPCGVDMVLGKFAFENTDNHGRHSVEEHEDSCCLAVVPQRSLHSGKVHLHDDIVGHDENGDPVCAQKK